MFILKKLRVFSWLIRGVVQKYFRLIIFSLVLGVAGFFLVSYLTPFLQKTLVPKKIGLIGHYTLAALPKEINRLLSSGLTKIDTDGRPYPYLVEDWEVSEDGKKYTFTLKPGLTWKNGTVLKTEDINFRLKDVTVKTLDEKRLEFELKEPFSPFPVLLAEPIFKKGLLGVGGFKVLKVKTNGQLVETITLKSEKQTLNFKFYPTEETAKTALKLSEINELRGSFSCEVEPGWENHLKVKKNLTTDEFVAIFYNTNDPNLAAKGLRQALSYAVKDRPQDSSRALGPVSPASWAFNPQVKRYDFNPQSAKELFAKFKQEGDEAGEEESQNGEQSSEETKLKLTISTVPVFLDLAEKVRDSWEEILDIEVEVKTINALTEEFQILLVAQEIPPDPDQYSLWHSTQASNITSLNSPKIDKLLEDGRKIADLKQRKEIYFDFQRFLLEECPATFLFHPYHCTISKK